MLKLGLKAAFTAAVAMTAYVGYLALSQNILEPAMRSMTDGSVATVAAIGLLFTQLAMPFVAGFGAHKALKKTLA